MTIPQPATGKFVCYTLRTWVSGDLTHPIKLGDGVYASATPQFVIDEWWQENLGALTTSSINQDSNLFLLASAEDQSVDEKYLERHLTAHYLSLLLQGVGYTAPFYGGGSRLSGDNSAKGMRVRGIGRLDRYYKPPKVIPAELNEEHLIASEHLARGVKAIFPENNWRGDFLRLRKGFNAYIDGLRHRHFHNRLHQFIRAIEAVIKPKQGEGTKKFQYRCQFFAGRKPDDVDLLGELYEMRCAAEHLNPMDDKLGKYPEHERPNLKALRTYQAELLAAFIYRKILLDPSVISHFKDDQTITDLWTGNDANGLISFWGDTINLYKIPYDHFYADLPDE